MRKYTTSIIRLLLGISLFLLPSCHIFADTYGTITPPANLTINKLVKNPLTGVYVENLTTNGPTYSPGTSLTFRLVVRNDSGETMSPVTIVDQLPSYHTFLSATIPATYDKGTNTVTMTITNLIAGDQATIDLVVKVAPQNAFASSRTMYCMDNYAKVTSPARPNGDDDSAGVCISTGKEILPVAGFNDLYTLLPFLGIGSIGLMLLKSKTYTSKGGDI